MKNKKTILCVRCVLVLLAFMLICPCSLAEEGEWISGHITVEAFVDGEWQELQMNLIFSCENGLQADGILHFSPLKAFIEDYPAPEINASATPYFRISYDSYVDAFSSTTSFYAPQDDKLIKLKDENNNALRMQDLEPGTYLMAIDIHGEHGQAYYTGACFLWITIE